MKAALGVAAALAVLAGGLLVLELARGDHVAEGVRVDGVEVGDRSRDEAASVIRDEVAQPLRRTIVARAGEARFELASEQSRVRIDVEAAADAALEASRTGIPGVRALGDVLGLRELDVDIEPPVRYDDEAVSAFVGEVAGEIEREPVDASISPSAGGLEVSEARAGRRVDQQTLERRVELALRAREERGIDVPVEAVEPDTTVEALAERHPHYLVVDRDDFRLLHYRDLELAETYPISVGRVGHNTPEGQYDISDKAVDPTWYVPDEPWAGEKAGETIPPGPDNPIKSRWLGIEDGIGIHGTDEEDSIGSRASAGCIRMLIADVEELYDEVPVGTAVFIS